MSCQNYIRERAHEFIQPLDDAQREVIFRAMILARGNIKLAASRLGMNRTTLQARLKKYQAQEN